MQISYGPVTDIAEQTHAVKYRQEGENFYEPTHLRINTENEDET